MSDKKKEEETGFLAEKLMDWETRLCRLEQKVEYLAAALMHSLDSEGTDD